MRNRLPLWLYANLGRPPLAGARLDADWLRTLAAATGCGPHRLVVHGRPAHDAEQTWGADPGGAEAFVEELRAEGLVAEHVSSTWPALAPDRLVQVALDASEPLDIVVDNHARCSAQALEELTAEGSI